MCENIGKELDLAYDQGFSDGYRKGLEDVFNLKPVVPCDHPYIGTDHKGKDWCRVCGDYIEKNRE